MLDIAIRRSLDKFTLAVALQVERELVVLFGRSGAGKTLTLRAVAGLFQPTQGRITLHERVLFDATARVNMPPQARRIGYVPQSYALFPHMTAAQNVAYALRGLSRHESERRVAEMIALVELQGFEQQRPAQLSGGQQQRVALARALAGQPDALLLDEPLSALDAPTRADLRRNLRELQARFQIPVLFVTHDLAEAYFMADRIAVYDAGRVWQMDTPSEVLRRPATRRVAQLMGVKNIFAGEVTARGADGLCVRVGQVELATPLVAIVGASVSLCVRPERIILVRPERLAQERENLLGGRIVGEMNDGSMVVLSFRLDGARLTPERAHDLDIELPVYIYERLGLASQREWHVSIKRDAIHVIPVDGDVVVGGEA
jgi:molybdate transport system ATP-binding protein